MEKNQFTHQYILKPKTKKKNRQKISKMKFILIVASLFIVALSAPLDSQVPVAQIIKSENNNVGLDNYNFS